MDKKALKILEKYSKSYTDFLLSLDFENKFVSELSEVELQYVIKTGYFFHEEKYTHEDLTKKVREIVTMVDLADVTNAFLVSLSTRRLELRSALGSYMCARNLPYHPPTKTIFAYSCGVCGLTLDNIFEEDLTIFNYERFKYGGVRHLDPAYQLFDLEQFIKLDKVEPTDMDYKILEDIISIILELPNHAKLNDLVSSLKDVFPSNINERRTLIDILGFCGILETDEHKGFYKQYIRHDCRALPPISKIDWAYPVMWWKGKNKINTKNYNEIFFKI